MKPDIVIEGEVIVNGKTFVALYTPQVLSYNSARRMMAVIKKEMGLKEFMEKVLNVDSSERVKHKVNAKRTTVNYMGTNCSLKTHLKQSFSAAES